MKQKNTLFTLLFGVASPRPSPIVPRTPTGGPGTHTALHGEGSACCRGPSVPPNSHRATSRKVCLCPHPLPLFTEMQLSPHVGHSYEERLWVSRRSWGMGSTPHSAVRPHSSISTATASGRSFTICSNCCRSRAARCGTQTERGAWSGTHPQGPPSTQGSSPEPRNPCSPPYLCLAGAWGAAGKCHRHLRVLLAFVPLEELHHHLVLGGRVPTVRAPPALQAPTSSYGGGGEGRNGCDMGTKMPHSTHSPRMGTARCHQQCLHWGQAGGSQLVASAGGSPRGQGHQHGLGGQVGTPPQCSSCPPPSGHVPGSCKG